MLGRKFKPRNEIFLKTCQMSYTYFYVGCLKFWDSRQSRDGAIDCPNTV